MTKPNPNWKPDKQTWWRIDVREHGSLCWTNNIYSDHIRSVVISQAERYRSENRYSEVRIIRSEEWLEEIP
jgi:hypothetical protein